MADNYVIPLKQVTSNKPRKGRAKKAIRAIKLFVKKHKRLNEDQIAISKEVNEKVWENGMFGIPKKIEVELKKIEEKTFVFLKDGTELKEKEKELKDKKKEKASAKPEKKTEEEIKEKAEQKQKLDEKRQKEKDAQKVELKRKGKE